MDVLANYSIFQELQLVHDTGYFSAMPSLEENWQQVRDDACICSKLPALLLVRCCFCTRVERPVLLRRFFFFFYLFCSHGARRGPLTGENTHARAHTRMHRSLRTDI